MNAAVVNVEYFRDIQPILARSCAACHTEKEGQKPAGNLVLDDANSPTVQATYSGSQVDFTTTTGFLK